jgi:hypothetical protein
MLGMGRQPAAERRDQALALGPIEAAHTPTIRATATPAFHLHQQQPIRFAQQQIDLPPAATPLACLQPPASLLEQA